MVLTALSAPSHAVDRPALRHQLDEALVHPLTLIVAPAGTGKTVLLSQWAMSHPELDFVWLDIAEADDDPVRFSERFIHRLAAVNPDLADLAELTSLHGGGLGAPLLEALEAQMATLPEVIIIFDDLHNLSNSTLISDLGRLVDVIPPNIHLVLSTRTDLPIAWSRHRMNDQLTEIRQSDLALDDTDSAVLLENITGRSLGTDRVANLVARTEGWAAGLQLAGMTLRLYDDSDEFITQFSGDDRLIVDYLSEEVLQAQPDDRRDTLLRVSVLDTMCADLVAHLTGEQKPQLILEELESESMFLVPLDTRRQWFRFHHLFRDMLRFTLRAEQPASETRLLNQAASWHLDRGELSSGVEYLLRAQNWDGVLEVIMARGSEVFEKGEMATVIRWISRVPESARAERHDVSLLLGILMGMEGQAAGAADILGRVATRSDASDGERVCAQAFLAAQVQWQPRSDVSVALAIGALELLDHIGSARIPAIMNLTHPQSLETMTTLSCGRAHFQAGDTNLARDWLDRGLASRGATYPIWMISGLGSLGLLEAWCGNTERARAIAEEALAIAKEVGLLAHPSASEAYLTTTLVALEYGEPGRASLSLHEGIVRAEANRRSQVSWFGHLEKALLQEADGKREQAMLTTLSTRSDLGAPPPPIVADRLLALQGRLLRLGGSPERALHTLGNPISYTAELAFECAATALTLGDHQRARKFVHSLAEPSEQHQPLAAVQGLILDAWLNEVEGSNDDLQRHLNEAMAIAERHLLVEVFLRAGPTFLRLISDRYDGHSAFRSRILRRSHEGALPSPGIELVEPLTDRELEILSSLPSRFTNTELADHFYVSVNTIKTHMAHIYRKLGVPNRNGAISRARQIGLL